MEFLDAYPWLLAIAIFVARITDVALGTFRTIVVFRGYRGLAAVIGFFEVVVWVLAAAQVLNNLDQWYLIIAYAGGFAAGNYIGMWLESTLAMGDELIRAISFKRGSHLVQTLREHGFKAIDLEGNAGPGQPCEVLLVVEKRRRVPRLLKLIQETDPDAVYSIADLKSVYAGPSDLIEKKPLFNAGWRVLGKRK